MKLCIHEILIGDKLKQSLSKVQKVQPRFLIHDLNNYLYKENNGKVCILYGLRRTGKSFMMYHSILNMREEDFNKTALININKNITIGELSHDLMELSNNNFKYVFIDEITSLEDFIDTANIFSDTYTFSGMKIVLSGTDSLGFIFANNSTLYDRCELIHTTYIPYYEYKYLFNKSLDEYIEYGGTLVKEDFATPKNAFIYTDTAIAKNIQNSLQYYDNGKFFCNLREPYYNNELTSSINKIIQKQNRHFIISTIQESFKSEGLGSTLNIALYNQVETSKFDKEYRKMITQKLMNRLNILDTEDLKIKMTQEAIDELKQYFEWLDLTIDLPIETFGSRNIDNEAMSIQPGMRYSQKKELEELLVKDLVFNSLKTNDQNLFLKILDYNVKGKILEEIILSNSILLLTKENLPNSDIYLFQARFIISKTNQGEIDMVIIDRKNNEAYLFEIEYSKSINENQIRNLNNEYFVKKLEETKEVKVKNKYVLYNGETQIYNGVQYLNAEEYLNKLLEFDPHYNFIKDTLTINENGFEL